MSQQTSFDEVLDAIESLPADQQADLVEVVQRRLAERERQRVVADVREARDEFAAGRTRPSNVDTLLRDIQS